MDMKTVDKEYRELKLRFDAEELFEILGREVVFSSLDASTKDTVREAQKVLANEDGEQARAFNLTTDWMDGGHVFCITFRTG